MADNPIIIYHKKYKESLARFSLDIQQKFMMATWQFVQDPHSLGLYVKPWISGGKASGIMEFRASDYYRCLYRDLGNRTYLFIYACGHNETNQGKKIASKLVTDPDYGNQELIPDDEVIDMLIEEIEKSLEPEDEELPKLFDDLSESTLRQLRIPPELYKLVRIIRTREQLKKLEDILPENVYHALDLVSCGESVSDVVILLFGDEEPEKPSPQNGEINNDPVTASSFISLRTKEEYEQNLTAPLESWRIFLHPEQRRLAEKDFSGPARVTGGAGTGKTVAAMHRAKWLAEHITDGSKVLFTTFTKNLAEDISVNLDRLIKDPTVRNRIVVKNLDSWLHNYMSAHSKDWVAFDSQLNKIWDKAYLQNSDESLTPDFYEEEWERVVLRYEAFDREAYRKVSRAGRPQLAGGTDKRDEVWKVFQAYMDQCTKKHQLDQGWAMIRCRKLIQAEGKALYRSIIVDEGQDFNIPAYKLLRAMAGRNIRMTFLLQGIPGSGSIRHISLSANAGSISKAAVPVCV